MGAAWRRDGPLSPKKQHCAPAAAQHWLRGQLYLGHDKSIFLLGSGAGAGLLATAGGRLEGQFSTTYHWILNTPSRFTMLHISNRGNDG
jgi:hypothetical protein